MKVLSLFDGMACGVLALLAAGIDIESYDAFEIDKYAIQTTSHNFPFIKHHGDVFGSPFTEFEGVDLLCGGSPCTYWSIAQKNNRETEASGMGWELFSQYVRALKEAKPKYFIYENNKSMSNAIRESISSTFGFEPVLINSALVSAQNRQRLYWVGKRNPDGTYSKVEVPQPEDRGILLKDILEGGLVDKEKAYCLKHQAGNARDYFKKHHTQIKLEPVRIPKYGAEDKSRPVTHGYSKQGCGQLDKNAFPENPNKQLYDYIAEPVRIPDYGNPDKARPLNALYPNNCGGFEHRIWSDKPNKQQVDMIAEPVNTTKDGKSQTIKAQYQQTSIANICCYTSTYGASGVAEPVRVGALPRPNGELSTSQSGRVYSVDGKSININAGGGGAGGKTGLYAIPLETDIVSFAEPCEWDENGKPIKAISYADGKTYQVYQVKDGLITIKGKQYPINLKDGYYIIRKLTVRECMRLQTVPEWYEFPVSDTQAYKMLGNGWTVDVIAHILKSINNEKEI